MIRSAIASSSWVSVALLVAFSAPASAAGRQRPVTDETVTVEDLAMTPLEDLNLAKDPIPPALLRAAQDPYRGPGGNTCADILHQIGDLDAVLGEDVDMGPREPENPANIGKIAQSMVGMLIPYRGLIRNVTGAERHAREFREAIAAGMMRRAYLKGLGQGLDCPYPARPAPPELIAATILKREEAAKAEGDQPDSEGTRGRAVPVADGDFVSQPVVQPTP